MAERLRVAAVQMQLRAEPSMDAFRRHVSALVDEGLSGGAELIVLPEMATTGLLATHPRAAELTAADLNAAYRDVLPPLTEELSAFLTDLARGKGAWLCGGTHWREAGAGDYRNSAFLAHPDGRLDLQDKLHLTWPEVELGTQPGEWIEPLAVGPASVAIQICADVEFAEVTRAMALKGVDLVLCPSLTWNRRGAHRVRYSCLARSVEHQVFVAMAPLVDSHGIPVARPLHGTGRALVTTPIDRAFGIADGVLAEADRDGEAMVFADLDLDQLRRSRAESDTPGLRHGRPELYERLMQDALAR